MGLSSSIGVPQVPHCGINPYNGFYECWRNGSWVVADPSWVEATDPHHYHVHQNEYLQFRGRPISSLIPVTASLLSGQPLLATNHRHHPIHHKHPRSFHRHRYGRNPFNRHRHRNGGVNNKEGSEPERQREVDGNPETDDAKRVKEEKSDVEKKKTSWFGGALSGRSLAVIVVVIILLLVALMFFLRQRSSKKEQGCC